MGFKDRSAGNWSFDARRGAPMTRTVVMAFRSALLVAVAALALPTLAHASDPLLSGYGSPGGGEQVVLGSKLLGNGGGGGGGGGPTASAPETLQAAPRPTQTPSAPGASAPEGAPAAPHGSTVTPGRSSGKTRRAARPADSRALPGAPPVVAYPAAAHDAGGLPFSGTDLAVLLGAAALLLVLAAALRRLTVPDGSSPAR